LFIAGSLTTLFVAPYTNIGSTAVSLNFFTQNNSWFPTASIVANDWRDQLTDGTSTYVNDFNRDATNVSYQDISRVVEAPLCLNIVNTDGNFTGGNRRNRLITDIVYREVDLLRT